MMQFDTKKVGMVRGYFIYADRWAGIIGEEQAKDDDNPHVGIAYTFWHRHNDDPTIIYRELENLCRCYSANADYAGGMIGYEYKPYKKC